MMDCDIVDVYDFLYLLINVEDGFGGW